MTKIDRVLCALRRKLVAQGYEGAELESIMYRAYLHATLIGV